MTQLTSVKLTNIRLSATTISNTANSIPPVFFLCVLFAITFTYTIALDNRVILPMFLGFAPPKS